jgi:uncharacterized coiled-coil DUF342 family protein
MIPDLIEHFEKFRDHRESYNKIKKNFPEYFKCIQEVMVIFKNKYESYLDLECDP